MTKNIPIKEQKKKRTATSKTVRAPKAKPAKVWNLTGNLINDIWDAWIVTDLKFNILEWNKAAEKMYGYGRVGLHQMGQGLQADVVLLGQFQHRQRHALGRGQHAAGLEGGETQFGIFDHSGFRSIGPQAEGVTS